jgi:hypothetical protein
MVHEEYVDKNPYPEEHHGKFDLVSTGLYASTTINDNEKIKLMYWPVATNCRHICLPGYFRAPTLFLSGAVPCNATYLMIQPED